MACPGGSEFRRTTYKPNRTKFLLPMRQAGRGELTLLPSRFLVTGRGFHPPREERSRVCNRRSSMPQQIRSHLGEPGWKTTVLQPVCQSWRFPTLPIRTQLSKHNPPNSKSASEGSSLRFQTGIRSLSCASG